MKKNRKRSKRPSAKRGELPGEYMRKSLVTVPSGILSDGGRIKDQHYVVVTSRLDLEFRVRVEHGGEEYTLPHKVVMQIQRHAASIIKQQRRDRAVEQAERHLRERIAQEHEVVDLGRQPPPAGR